MTGARRRSRWRRGELLERGGEELGPAVELATGAHGLVGVGLDGGHAIATAGEHERAVAATGADVEHGRIRRDGRGEGHELATDDVVGVHPKRTLLREPGGRGGFLTRRRAGEADAAAGASSDRPVGSSGAVVRADPFTRGCRAAWAGRRPTRRRIESARSYVPEYDPTRRLSGSRLASPAPGGSWRAPPPLGQEHDCRVAAGPSCRPLVRRSRTFHRCSWCSRPGLEILDRVAEEADDRGKYVDRALRTDPLGAHHEQPGEDDPDHRDDRDVVGACGSALRHGAPPTTPPI